MTNLLEVIEALGSTAQPCRRLDALVTAWAYGPAGWALDPVEDLDGWGINHAPDAEGRSELWMCAADVPYVTRYMDAAMELITAACPGEASIIATRAMTNLLRLPSDGRDFGQRAACALVAELLRHLCVQDDANSIREMSSAA